jgi:hypothetical protein
MWAVRLRSKALSLGIRPSPSSSGTAVLGDALITIPGEVTEESTVMMLAGG